MLGVLSSTLAEAQTMPPSTARARACSTSGVCVCRGNARGVCALCVVAVVACGGVAAASRAGLRPNRVVVGVV